MLTSMKDFPEFSVYDEPVRKVSIARASSRNSQLGKSHNFRRISFPEHMDPTVSTDLRRFPTFEEEQVPFRSRVSEIKKVPAIHGLSQLEFADTVNKRKKYSQTLTAFPDVHQFSQRTEVRRRYK
jgi:hypothetical protein